MMSHITILKSSKRIGKYESVIIKKLEHFFHNQGFQVVSHARLNISWGNIISDIDLLLIKENRVGIVEVKSSHDNLKRAKKQISNIKDYVDFVYIATDFRPRKLPTPIAGWIFAKDKVMVMKHPKTINNKPSYHSVNSLPKKCLELYLNQKKISSKGMLKHEITQNVMSLPTKNLKEEIKSMAICGQECDVNCPIWDFEKLLIPKILIK